MRFVQMLNRFVSVVLVSVALTAALQFAGVASHSKDSTDFEAMEKAKGRDYATDVIDGIFNIPIATLNAVSSLVQTTGPLFQRTPEQRAEARKSRAELLRAKAADRQSRNDARALRRGDRGRSVYTHIVETRPVVVESKH